ncbi:MAG: helix-hairpin-helix domain-containing protein [Myxococcales bacterium]|nr:helix-hairpin-helix domain-containing protein [Myxococcales bacterium]
MAAIDRRARGALVLVLTGAAAAAHWPRASGPAPRPCAAPVAVGGAAGEVLMCSLAPLEALLRVCPPTGPIRPGDRLTPTPTLIGCRLSVRPLPAARRLALGLKLDVNGATARELEALAGVGPATAAALVAARPYRDWVDLERARGIGPTRRARLRPHLTLRPPPPLRPSSSPPRDASAPRTPSGSPRGSAG